MPDPPSLAADQLAPSRTVPSTHLTGRPSWCLPLRYSPTPPSSTSRSGTYSEADIRIEEGKIAEVGRGLTAPGDCDRTDLKGEFVLPGLIDAHVHLVAANANLGQLASWSRSYLAYHTARLASAMLDRGFTTVRDMGGADYGVAAALSEGLIRGRA